jgi:hypothetical protein
VRRPDAGEDLTSVAAWPSPNEPAGDRLADIGRQRQAFVLWSLAPDEQLAIAPVDVVQTQGGHLAGTQPQTREQHQHGEVTPPESAPPVTASKECDDVIRIECSGQSGEPPGGDLWDRAREGTRRAAGEVTEAQEGPKPGGDIAGRASAAAPALLSNEVENLQRPDVLKPEARHLRPRRQEQAGDAKVSCDRSSRKAPFIDQVAAEVLEQVLSRRPRDGRFRNRCDAHTT